MRTEYAKNALMKVAETWSLEHLNSYVENLQEQIKDIRDFIRQLKIIQKAKEKERSKKFRDTGPRGAA